MIKTFQQFVNEDATADLIQQKNSLSQQINDLQKKLLDVQAQIVNAQKQTLSQNPQSQIPMGESLDNNGGTNQPKKVIDTFYAKERGMRGKLVIEFDTPSPDGEGNEGEVFDVRNFEDFVEDLCVTNTRAKMLQNTSAKMLMVKVITRIFRSMISGVKPTIKLRTTLPKHICRNMVWCNQDITLRGERI